MAGEFKVVVTDYIEADLDWEREQLAKRGVGFECYQLKQAPEEEVMRLTADADVVVVNMVKVTPRLVDSWTKCRMVIRHGAGYDNVNVQALTDRGIVLEYIPDYCQHEVAEHAIALMFACCRKVVWGRGVFDDSVARGEWDFKPIVPMFRMAGSTVGIIGCGRIGSLVYRKMSATGVKLMVCDPYLSERTREELNIEPVSLEELCKSSDLVTLHTPLNDETRGIINAKSLSWMKPTAYLVNTSRGGMVDHDALADALKSRSIAGAAIDVFEKEPPNSDFPLIGLDNVIITPHLSWYSKDAEQTIREKILEDIFRMIDGLSPRIPVNPEVLRASK